MDIAALLAHVCRQDADATPETGPMNPISGAVPPPGEVCIATFCGFGPGGQFLVAGGAGAPPQSALSAVALRASDIGRQVVVAPLPACGPHRLAIVACVQCSALPRCAELKMDGERLVLHAERDIELRCGEASIVLTRAGKVLIQGDYVLSRSRGANRIKGAYVDIN